MLPWLKRKPQTPRRTSAPLSHLAKGWLIAMFAVVCAPQAGQLPSWLVLLAIGIMGWLALMLFRPAQALPMPKWLKITVVVGVVMGVFASAGILKGLEGLSTLLVAGITLKLLELRNQRDGWVMVLVSCFIAAENFLFNESILFALHGLLSLAMIFAALNAMHSSRHYNRLSWRPLRLSATMLLQSVPIMLLLFIIFPRVGPLWSVKYDGAVAQTGLSDTLSPGSISDLTRSDKVAFRVSFADNQPPAQHERYWRAMTYDHFDGQHWLLEIEEEVSPHVLPGPETVTYQVIAEPSARPWLFALDYPLSNPETRLSLLGDGTLRAPQPLQERLSYTGISSPGSQVGVGEQRDITRFLQVPAVGNPKTRQLAAQWQRDQLTPRQMLADLLERFNRSFTYTLSPPLLEGERTDQFLFETQAGFCEHYASATAFALRLAGVPTRVVGGYMGGEWNPYEQYMLVRQYEAHAWIEIWLADEGWVRVDPTAAVAPERIEQPFDRLFANEPAFMADTPLSILNIEKELAFMSALRLRYEALNYSWHRWVLGYHNQQANLLKDWFGRLHTAKMLALLLIPVALVLGGLLLWLQRSGGPKQDWLDKDLQQLSRQLSARDEQAARAPGETVARYAQRLGQHYPELAPALKGWAGLYQQIRYQNLRVDSHHYRRQWQELLIVVRRLKPKPGAGK